MSAVLVIGGTGTTGSRVATMVGDKARIATRKPSAASHVRFDWTDPGTYGPALAGVDRVYLVAPIGVAAPVPIVEPFLHQASTLGVRRVVLLSSSAVDPDSTLGALHQSVRTLISEWTVLRPSWFMQNFTGDHALATGIRSRGEIVTATGEGRVPFIDATDIAAVATHALLDSVPHNAEHILTGPEALTYTEAAAIITEVTGHPTRHRTVSPADLTTRLVEAGLPAPFADILAALDTGIRHGSEDRVTTTVHDITGRPARSFRDFIAANRKPTAEIPAAG
ncbi:MAG: NmrA family NAD(P)-binding protein [Kibdelosporangium sp.]